ncbi:MAG: RND family transporter, partial [Christensenellales bacterium]
NDDYSDETKQSIKDIGEALSAANYDFAMDGTCVGVTENGRLITEEMPVVFLVACAIVLVILLLTSHSWMEPVVFAIVLFSAIIINLGSNALFDEVSFVTQAICAVLQLALAMDYSIILLHRFGEEKKNCSDVKEAMSITLSKSVAPILASSLTTIAGLSALLVMKFTIGQDIGIVLAKGILISLLTSFFMLPCVMVMFSKLLDKTRHKAFVPGTGGFANFAVKCRKVLPAVALVLIVSAYAIQTGMNFTYSVGVNPETEYAKQKQEIVDTFGTQNNILLLVPKSDDIEKQKAFATILISDEKYHVSGVQSLASTGLYDVITVNSLREQYGLDALSAIFLYARLSEQYGDTVYAWQLLEYLNENPSLTESMSEAQRETLANSNALAMKAREMFVGTNYERIILNFALTVQSDMVEESISEIKSLSETYYPGYYIGGEVTSSIDIMSSFSSDVVSTNLFSLIAIFLIIMFTFRSLMIPVVLVAVIQGAIWINFAATTIVGNPVFFMCYIIAMCIQMGATIDYGILLTNRYVDCRKSMGVVDSVKAALNAASITIFASGSIICVAAYTVGFMATMPLISEIGFLLGNGTLISIAMIVLLLPSCLILFDKAIERTTLSAKFQKCDGLKK